MVALNAQRPTGAPAPAAVLLASPPDDVDIEPRKGRAARRSAEMRCHSASNAATPRSFAGGYSEDPISTQARRARIRQLTDDTFCDALLCVENATQRWVTLFDYWTFVIQRATGTIEIALNECGNLSTQEATLASDRPCALPIAGGVDEFRMILRQSVLRSFAKWTAGQQGIGLDLRVVSPFGGVTIDPSTADVLAAAIHEIEHQITRIGAREWALLRRRLIRLACIGPVDRKQVQRWWISRDQDQLLEFHNFLQSGNAKSMAGDADDRLLAHAAMHAFDGGHAFEGIVSDALAELRRDLRAKGVTRSGWRVLRATPLREWKRRMPHGYDFESVAEHLRLAQMLQPPALPHESLVAMVELGRDQQVEPRDLPVRLVRLLNAECVRCDGDDTRLAGAELVLLMRWAAARRRTCPRSTWRASRNTLVAHALRWVRKFHAPGDPDYPGGEGFVFSHGDIAIEELTTPVAVWKAGHVLSNCLVQSDEMESDRRLFFASDGREECAVSFEWNRATGEWDIGHVLGPGNADASPAMNEAADALLAIWNLPDNLRLQHGTGKDS